MMNTLTLLLVYFSLSCCAGQSMESIPSGSVVKRPGETLSLSCRGSGFTFNCCSMNWIRQPAGKGLEWIGRVYSDASGTEYANSVQGRIEVTRDNSNRMVYMRLSNLKPDDSAVYYCAKGVYYAFDYWGKGTTVTVTTGAVTGPTVFPLQPCDENKESEMISFACLATGFTPSSLTFSWSANGNVLSDSIQYPPVLKNNVYTGVSQIQVRRQDYNNTQSYKCDVAHQGGNAHGTIMFDPFPAVQLPTLTMLVSEVENNVTFSCLAKEFLPKTHEFKWLKNNQEITNSKSEINTTSESKNVNGTTVYNAASFLTVDGQEWGTDAEFTCLFESTGKEGAPAFMNSTLVFPPVVDSPCETIENIVKINIIPPSLGDLFLDSKGTVLCEVSTKNAQVTKIQWLNHDGREMAEGATVPNRKTGTFTAPLLISYDEWNSGIVRTCLVEVDGLLEPLKKTFTRTAGGHTQRPSVFMLPPIEHTKKESVTLTCYVKDFFPADIFVSWLVDDEPVDQTYEFNTTSPLANGGTFYVYSHLSVTAEQWKEKDTVYSCVIYHESVINSTKTIVRSIGHRSLETTNLVNLSMNIPETCKAQ